MQVKRDASFIYSSSLIAFIPLHLWSSRSGIWITNCEKSLPFLTLDELRVYKKIKKSDVEKSLWPLLDVMDRIPSIFVSKSSSSRSFPALEFTAACINLQDKLFFKKRKRRIVHIFRNVTVARDTGSKFIRSGSFLPYQNSTTSTNSFFVYIWSTAQCNNNDDVERSMTSTPT